MNANGMQNFVCIVMMPSTMMHIADSAEHHSFMSQNLECVHRVCVWKTVYNGKECALTETECIIESFLRRLFYGRRNGDG